MSNSYYFLIIKGGTASVYTGDSRNLYEVVKRFSTPTTLQIGEDSISALRCHTTEIAKFLAKNPCLTFDDTELFSPYSRSKLRIDDRKIYLLVENSI